MSRCVICDRTLEGLSYYRPDGFYQSKHFHESDGKVYCDECETSYSETMSDYYDNDLEREEDDDAFEFYSEVGEE